MEVGKGLDIHKLSSIQCSHCCHNNLHHPTDILHCCSRHHSIHLLAIEEIHIQYLEVLLLLEDLELLLLVDLELLWLLDLELLLLLLDLELRLLLLEVELRLLVEVVTSYHFLAE